MKKWNYVFDCPDQKKVRMIVYTDCKNEADDHKYIHKKIIEKSEYIIR